DADDAARQGVLQEAGKGARQQACDGTPGEGDGYDHDEDEIDRHRAADGKAREGRLQREGGRDGQDNARDLHSCPPGLPSLSRTGVGARTTSTSSSPEKSTAGLMVMRLYAPPLFSIASILPIANPFG